jgi:sulfur transfer protein SufE
MGFLVRSTATPDEVKMQNVKMAQNRTKFVFWVSWFARRLPRMKSKCKTSKRLKNVQSSILGFLVRSTATPRSKKKYKASKSLKIVQNLILVFLGSLAGHTPDEDKMQNFKKA